ncbi:MAG: DEAD/DEAH box helicase [Clostridia bacterium]|nr:DEAD/DEAH box helicase [Clostridia bacterium]
MAIPRGLIRKMADDDAIYTQGLSLAGKSFSYDTKPTEFHNIFQVNAYFSNDDCRVFLEIDNENEEIEDVSCSCDKKEICPHIVALLIKIENDFFPNGFANRRTQNQPVETDRYITSLISNRADILKARSLYRAGGSKALLLPVLHITKNNIRLSFKLGCKKAYIVKDLNDLYLSVLHRTTGSCGRSDHFLYAPENFQNEALLRFFMTFYPLCQEEARPKYMRLTPEAMDHFFALFSERKLPCDGKTLAITTTTPTFSLFVRQFSDVFHLSLDKRNFTLYNGFETLYLLQDDTLYACSTEFSDACGGLLRRFAGNETNPTVLAEDMRTFYSMVLKPATRFIELRARDNDFIPPILKTKIYLDTEAGKTAIAKAEFYYDDLHYYAFDPNRDLQTVWDIEGETKIENLIKQYFPNTGKAPGTATFIVDDEMLFNLVYEGIPALSRQAELFISKELQSVKVKSFPKAHMGVRMESELLTVDITAGNLSANVLAAALTAYRQKKKYLRIKDGTFLLLDSDNLIKLNTVAESAGVSLSELKKKEIQLPAYRALYLDSVKEIDVAKEKSFTDLVAAFTETEKQPPLLTKKLSAILRDYQKQGVWWLQTLSRFGFGGILADDMGLGKTIQVLALFSSYKQTNGSCHALVVCPASLVLNWEQEIKKFTPELSAKCILGTTEERAALLSDITQDNIIITSYELLKRDAELYKNLHFDFEVIDEAQYIKNHNTQNARCVKSIHARYRFALTGTPIENSMSELWSIFDFLMPGYLHKYTYFRNRFEIPVIKEGYTAALDELKRMVSPFILRRLKKDVLTELPDKTETVMYTNLAPEQKKLYYANLASIQKELHTELQSVSGKNRMVVLAMLTRLRQLCCDPALLYDNYKEESAKFELCMNLVENTIQSGHKILLFSQFTSMLSMLESALKARHIPYYLIEGSTKKEERLRQVKAFNHDDTPVFLISLKAGGTGLNLTGADVVIHYDPWWNLSAQNQATDRAHRIGQKNSVSVYKLIVKGTIEEKILALAEKKQSLAEQILPDDGSILQGMSKEQILDLFNH